MTGHLHESTTRGDDPDARWRRGHVDVLDAPSFADGLAVSPEALMFRAPLVPMLKSPVRAGGSPDVVWWLLVLIGVVGFVFLIRALFERTAWSAGDSVPTVQAAEPRMLPAPSGEAPRLMDMTPRREPPVTVHAPNPTAPRARQPTASEIRESQRKADAAMKVIEATTPEM